MYEEINRFLTADYTGKEDQYTALLGTLDWKKVARRRLIRGALFSFVHIDDHHWLEAPDPSR